MAKRAVIVLNPAARKAPGRELLERAARALDGWEVALWPTEAAGHATELARKAASEGVDVVVACGGDGTVNEVANGLAGTQTALAVIPAGTANVWAKEVRIPRRPDRALGVLTDGETRTIDLGLAGERYFLNLATAGFDAAVVRDTSSAWKRRIGAAAFVFTGVRRALSHRAVETELRTDGDERLDRLYWLLLGNTRSYGGVLNIADRALADDGALELFLLRKGGLLRLLSLLPSVLLHRHHTRANVLYDRGAEIEVRAPGLAVQLDGEYHGETPMTFRVAPNALRVVVPRGLRSPLFSAEAAPST